MDDYAGRVLADRYRLPLPPSDGYELVETRAFDTYSGQEVLVRQVPLPEVVDAEVVDASDGTAGAAVPRRTAGRTTRTTRRPTDPAVRRAVEAAQAAAQIPDHPRLDQVFDVFAEGGSLWIVSERVAARPLAALLAEKPLSPYRAAEVASDVLTALRVLHAHGWTHRNITVRTVLVCDDGRVVLTGLASGAAEEALCGYDPVPEPPQSDESDESDESDHHELDGREVGAVPAARASLEIARSADTEVAVPDVRAARAGAIAAYRAGARAAARVSEDQRQGAGSGYAGSGPVQGGFDPDWWARQPGEIEYDDEDADDDADEFGDAGSGGTARLAGTWHDAPRPGHDGPGPVPAGGNTDPYGGELPYGYRRALPGPGSAPLPTGGSGSWERGGGEALRADAQRTEAQRPPVVAGAGAPTGRWDELVASGSTPAYRGPATPLAAERARQARIAVVGAVTERWAPEQAGPVHENWQLAAPVGPATDLWALGALLYRAVQDHAPYPEESAVELVQLVCAEPPAFAEECGPLRPVVESLLRQDPTERPEFEELRGWLRSLVRSAPEPEAGMDVVPLPSSPVDRTRLPVVRRRGELVRRRRAVSAEVVHGRHRHQKANKGGTPRSLGRTLLLVILLAMVAAVAYAVLFMPKSESQQQNRPQGSNSAAPQEGGPSPDRTAPESPGSPQTTPTRSPSEQQPQTSAPAKNLPNGYVLRTDPEGFQIAVDKTWERRPINDAGQVRYADGDFTLIVVPGRDSVKANGDDPLVYQRDKERELQPFRDSSWAGATGLRRIEIGRQVMAEGQFTWQDSSGREVYVRNLALILKGSYHVIQVIGPEAQRDKVSEIYQQATTAYRATR